jgi:hypothetical protein
MNLEVTVAVIMHDGIWEEIVMQSSSPSDLNDWENLKKTFEPKAAQIAREMGFNFIDVCLIKVVRIPS